MSLGNITLKTTTQGSAGEACLTLINTTKPGAPVFNNLANIRFGKLSSVNPTSNEESRLLSSLTLQPSRQPSSTMAVPAPGLDLTGKYKWLIQDSNSLRQKGTEEAWKELQQATGWVDGQDSLDSIYSPLEIEVDADSGLFD